MELRDYQKTAIEKLIAHVTDRKNVGVNACVVAPTGSGKSILIAETIRYFHKKFPQLRFLVVVHTKELIQQNYEKFCSHYEVDKNQLSVGIYSAGLKRKDADCDVLFAGIQSLKGKELHIGHRDFIIVDEAHHIPKAGNGSYRTFISELKKINKWLCVVGFTATPYRTQSGSVCGKQEKGFILNKIIHEISIKELITDGYLTLPVCVKSTNLFISTEGIKKQSGDFNNKSLALSANKKELVCSQVSEFLSLTAERKGVIVFCCDIDHCESVASQIRLATDSVGFVHSQIENRDFILQEFKEKRIKYLVNVNVLTEGFDAPHIDCVVMLRPTCSAGLYYQMIGRGLRLDYGKTDCLILDYGQNIMRHGPIDQITSFIKEKSDKKTEAPKKKCQKCSALCPAAARVCEFCGFQFDIKESVEKDLELDTISEVITRASVCSKMETTEKTFPVGKVTFDRHKGKGGKQDTLKISYYKENGIYPFVSEWLCVEHSKRSLLRKKADYITSLFFETPALSIEDALSKKNFNQPESVEIERVGKYFSVIKRNFKEKEIDVSNK